MKRLLAAFRQATKYALTQFRTRQGLLAVAGGTIAIGGWLLQLGLFIAFIAVAALAFAVAVLAFLVGRTEQPDQTEDLDAEAAIEQLVSIAEDWMARPIQQPSRESLPVGERLLANVDAMGASRKLTPEAERLILLLAIQHGRRWWYWFQRARGYDDLADLLMVPLRTANLGWIRVAFRAAYLLQCFTADELNRAVAKAFPSGAGGVVEPILKVIRSKSVLADVHGTIQGVPPSLSHKYSELIPELAHAEAELQCASAGEPADAD